MAIGNAKLNTNSKSRYFRRLQYSRPSTSLHSSIPGLKVKQDAYWCFAPTRACDHECTARDFCTQFPQESGDFAANTNSSLQVHHHLTARAAFSIQDVAVGEMTIIKQRDLHSLTFSLSLYGISAQMPFPFTLNLISSEHEHFTEIFHAVLKRCLHIN